MRNNSRKNVRINAEVQRSLSEIIRNLKDPRIAPLTSVTDVYVAPDLKTCKVMISVLGDEEDRKKTMEGLASASGFIRKELAADVNLRTTPELTFASDRSIENGVRMSKLIDDVIARDRAAEEKRREAGEDSEDEEA